MQIKESVLSGLRRLPLLRAYPALQDAREQIRRMRSESQILQADLEQARNAVEQRELTLRSIREGDLQLLAAPVVDYERLGELARQRGSDYRQADPFPHFVEDELFNASILDRVLAEFEAMERGGWNRSDGTHERKWSTDDPRLLGPFTSALIAQLNGGLFLGFLEQLTGITGLVPDPYLRGGGLHEIRRGGLLGIHADFNVHPRLKLYRRLNLLVYLNKAWDESWGGALELWDREGRGAIRTIPPVFNRTVLFDTSNFSYHGHPHPLACPPDRSRKSVALYYYSAECPAEADRTAHGTIFLEDREPAPT